MAGSNIFKITVFITFFVAVFGQETQENLPKPIIKALNIESNIKFTYARTFVTSKILNPANKSQEVLFRVVLPEEAFITGLVLTIKDKQYEAYVKLKEEAKKEYDAAVSAGISAAHVFQDPRNSKDFTVAVNVESQEKVGFNLTYEELLSRKNRTYRNDINVSPSQIVDNLSVAVNIEDFLNITNVEVTEFVTSNDIQEQLKENIPAKKTIIAPNKVRVEWNPTPEEQKKLSKDGLNGKFGVKYDVDASENAQQIIVDSDGYFVHILRNDNLPVLSKHVVFVLDVSGSMHGTKIDQLKDAMKKILHDLSEKDKFSIILFSVKVLAWSPKEKLDLNELNQFNEDEPANVIAKEDYIVPVTKENIEEATKFVDSLSTYGGTNIMGGLRNGLKLARLGKKEMNSDAPHESMLIFLTDGQPNSEESDPAKITANVKEDNKGVTIFSLGFGYDVDMNFLKKLALANNGFARRIYVDSDASMQLQNFYKEVASPVLSDVKFEYLPGQVESTTSDGFKNLFYGSDLSVFGKVKPEGKIEGALVANTTSGVQRYGILPIHIIRLPPIPKEDNKTYGYLEKMWAYKTIKTLLDKNIVSKNDSLEEKAKELSLKYSFVTPLTSLIVVKPNDSSVVDENKNHGPGYGGGAYPISAAGGGGFPGSANYLAQGAGGFAGPMFTTAMHSMHMRPMMPTQPLPPMAPATPEMMIDMDNSTTEENPWYSQVSWLNKNMTSADGLYLIPPAALNTSDVIALNPDMNGFVANNCTNGNPCLHFKNCTLSEFFADVNDFIPYQCHIDPKYLGVCCPN